MRNRSVYHRIVIVNSRFLQRPQKRNHWNQFIHRCSGSNPESQAGRQSNGYGGWYFGVETGTEVGRRGQIRIGFVEEQGFQLEWKICGEIARGAVLVRFGQLTLFWLNRKGHYTIKITVSSVELGWMK